MKLQDYAGIKPVNLFGFGRKSPFTLLTEDFEDLFSRPLRELETCGQNLLRAKADILETEKDFKITMEVPGLTAEDVKVTLEDNVLSISAETKREEKEDTDRYHRLERTFGTLNRSFSFHADIAEDGIDASVKNGVLNVVVPKLEIEEKETVKTIEVKSE